MANKAAWDIYPKELAIYGYGVALWQPNPPSVNERPNYEKIEVGDIGTIRSGQFQLLFNVFLDGTHPRQTKGVPVSFTPLLPPIMRYRDPGEVLREVAPYRGDLDVMPLKSDNISYVSASASASAAPGPIPLQAGAQFTFKLSKKSGGLLLFHKPAMRYEMEDTGPLEIYVRRNYKSWMTWVREELQWSVDLSDLHIVTGVIRTSEWRTATWSTSDTSFSATASLSMPGVADGSLSLGRHWMSPNQSIMTNQGPAPHKSHLTTDNQTIFISALRMKSRGPLFPPKLYAAADPHDLGSGERDTDTMPEVVLQDYDDSDIDIIRIPDHSKDKDPLLPIQDYILEVCPDAEAALARDSDLLPYLEGSYDASAIRERLKVLNPQVVLDSGVGTLRHPEYSVIVHRFLQWEARNAPVPLPGILNDVESLVHTCEDVNGNKRAARHLCEWLCEMAFFSRRYPGVQFLDDAGRLVSEVRGDMQFWSCLPWVSAIVMRDYIQSRIDQFHLAIRSFCMEKSLRTHSQIEDTDLNKLTVSLQEMSHDDYLESLDHLSNDSRTQAILEGLPSSSSGTGQDERHEALCSLAKIMQEGISEYIKEDSRKYGLQKNLYRVLQESGELLPDLELRRGEVVRDSDQARSGTAKYDVFDGWYLSSEKVTIKEFRLFNQNNARGSNEDKYRYRFLREAAIWLEVWKADRGKYIVPFYGYCISGMARPYMVSPYFDENVSEYVKRVPDVNHVGLLRNVAEGVRVLHSMDPPVVHGNIRGSNIFISADGRPLLGNFRFSKLMEDIMGEPFTSSSSAPDDVRWSPPEFWVSEPILSTESDIYQFGMTMLELFTHDHPFREVKYSGTIVEAVTKGTRPKRPVESDVLRRGLSDDIWSLMQACWMEAREQRPKIEQVITTLNSSSA